MPWRFNDKRLETARHVKDLWPDVDKTIIYQDMLDYGIDAGEIIVQPANQFEMESVMGVSMPKPNIPARLWISIDTINDAYPGDEAKYIGLVHELAHFRQALVGGLGPPRGKEWYEQQHEQEANRWSARQAKLMGWSEQRLTKFLERR